MLSGVKLVDRADAERLVKAEKRNKHKEKKKKHKKEKAKQRRGRTPCPSSGSDSGPGKSRRRAAHSSNDGGGSSSGGDGEDDAWQQQLEEQQGLGGAGTEDAGNGKAQREDWMTVPMARSQLMGSCRGGKEQQEGEDREKEQQAQRPDPDEIKVSAKELNPDLRAAAAATADGGDGAGAAAPAAAAAAAAPVRAVGVGDGGASWRLKALKRAQAQAEAEGKGLNDVVSERWGSLAQLSSSLTERRAAPGMAHLHAARSRRQEGGGGEGRERDHRGGDRGEQEERGRERGTGERGERAGYLEDVKSAKSQMLRPKAPDSLSWRRDRGPGGDRGSEGDRHKAAAAAAAGQRSRQGDGGGAPGGREQQQEGRSGGAAEAAGAADARREEDGSRQRHDHGEGDRTRSPGAHREAQRSSDRGGRDRSGDRRRDGSRGRRPRSASPEGRQCDSRRGGIRLRDEEGGRGGRGRGGAGAEAHQAQRRAAQRDVLGRGEQAELLRAAAAGMNAFSSDGSFLERFAAQQGQREAAGGGGGEASPRQQEVYSPPDSPTSGADYEETQRAQQQHTLEQQLRHERATLGRGQQERSAVAGGSSTAGAAPGSGSASAAAGTAGNRSAAAMLKARLQGKALPAEASEPAGRETVVLPLVDSQGKAVPGAFGREKAGATAEPGRRPKRLERYEGGEKARYYKDDDVDLQTLVKRTKYEGVGDLDANLAHNIMRKANFKERDMDADAEYDHDAGLDMAEARAKRGDPTKQAAREKQRQIRDYKHLSSALDQCTRCFASASRLKHLTVAIGQGAYLALPDRGRLVPGHCCIIPTEHVASSRQVDEAVWTELRNFKKCLIQMFMQQGLDCIFLETAVQLGSIQSHAVVECVPVPPEAASKAPMYFKKAIDDATSDWAQHHAKRIIDTKAKGLRGSIPPNFPYLHIEFGIAGGFVHVIDDESKFDRGLARNVMIGLLGLPEEDMHRRARQESASIQGQWAADFRKQFQPYDWTKMLE